MPRIQILSLLSIRRHKHHSSCKLQPAAFSPTLSIVPINFPVLLFKLKLMKLWNRKLKRGSIFSFSFHFLHDLQELSEVLKSVCVFSVCFLCWYKKREQQIVVICSSTWCRCSQWWQLIILTTSLLIIFNRSFFFSFSPLINFFFSCCYLFLIFFCFFLNLKSAILSAAMGIQLYY